MSESLECPQCGSNEIDMSTKTCCYCHSKIFVSSIAYLSSYDNDGIKKYLAFYKKMVKDNPENIEGRIGLGICFLQLNMYPLALKEFEFVIDNSPDVSQAYYYKALSLIAGKRMMTLPLKVIKELVSLIEAACMIGAPEPHYLLLKQIIKKDYYDRNGMIIPEALQGDFLLSINLSSIDEKELQRLKECVKIVDLEDILS